MKQLPDKYKEIVPSHLIVVWWGTRKFYEVIEELADSLLGLSVIWVTAIFLYSVFDLSSYLFMLAASLSVIPLIPFIVELEKFYSEILVVCDDPNQSQSGSVFKITGVFNYRTIEIPITSRSPVPVVDEYENNLLYLMWKRLTLDRMQRVTLNTDVHKSFLDNKRISPEFIQAINRVKGSSGSKKDVPPVWQNVQGITQAERWLTSSEIRHYIREFIDRSLE